MEDERADHWLQLVGWYPGRDVGVDACGSRELVAGGYQVSAQVEAVLREFSELDFSRVREIQHLYISGKKAAEDKWPQMMHIYSDFFGREMTPIGEQGLLMVMCDPEGGIWVANAEYYEYLGPDFRSALRFWCCVVKYPLRGTIPADQYEELGARYYGST